jgi:phosphate transport system permease protein
MSDAAVGPAPVSVMGGRLRARLIRDRVFVVLCVVALFLAIGPLFWVLWEVVTTGMRHISWAFITETARPPTVAAGGWSHAILGTIVTTILAVAIGLPIGLSAGIYMSEFGHNVLGRTTRFLAEVLAGMPSIIAGMVAYAIVVLAMGRFSIIAGAIALALLFIPIVAITTQEALQLVPRSHREASYALGMPEAPTTLKVVFPAAFGNILTGIMIAVARVAGETAPLLFTAFNSRFHMTGLDQPAATIPVNIYVYAISPFTHWHNQAWAGALILLAMVLTTNVIARTLWERRARFMRGGR